MAKARKTGSQVSIIGSSYCQPIADLLERWLSREGLKSTAVQSGYFECGYAASVILLAVAMLESYVVRVRYINRATVPVNLRGAIDVLLHVYPRLRHREALTEIYVVRDLIFHNHLWEIQWSASGSAMVVRGAAKHPAFGDKKYLARVNSKTRRTKALKLSVVPTRIDRRDASKVLQAVWKTLLYIEAKDRNQCYVSDIHVEFRGNEELFSKVIGYFGRAS